MKDIIEEAAEEIKHNHKNLNAWIATLRTKEYRSKIPMNIFAAKLKQECPKLKQEEVIAIIHFIDRKRKGFVLDFRLKSIFTSVASEGCHPVVERLAEILRMNKTNLPQYLKTVTDSTGSINQKRLMSLLQSEMATDKNGDSLAISAQETRSMMIFLNIKREDIDLVEF